MTKLEQIEKLITELANEKKAESNLRFFKTGVGEYSSHDKFIGLTVPDVRKIAKQFPKIEIDEFRELLESEYNEIRMLALMILVNEFASADELEREKITKLYLDNTKYINNWNLVDLSASQILGKYLINKDPKILSDLAKSTDLWERRIAVVACYEFIKNKKFEIPLKIIASLLSDKHDLIHKANGWMLREVGKRDVAILDEYLETYLAIMPRTTLRYAIERFPEDKRKEILKK